MRFLSWFGCFTALMLSGMFDILIFVAITGASFEVQTFGAMLLTLALVSGFFASALASIEKD